MPVFGVYTLTDERPRHRRAEQRWLAIAMGAALLDCCDASPPPLAVDSLAPPSVGDNCPCFGQDPPLGGERGETIDSKGRGGRVAAVEESCPHCNCKPALLGAPMARSTASAVLEWASAGCRTTLVTPETWGGSGIDFICGAAGGVRVDGSECRRGTW
ncbi:hypothetical protein C8R46DRAFT_1314162 [Mycena filopes]|nr:hypothetical protein C8R46DRAFT_1314162 [Mycena filopes]